MLTLQILAIILTVYCLVLVYSKNKNANVLRKRLIDSEISLFSLRSKNNALIQGLNRSSEIIANLTTGERKKVDLRIAKKKVVKKVVDKTTSK